MTAERTAEPAQAAQPALLRIEDLRVHFTSRTGFGRPKTVKAVDGVNLEIGRGETLGLVGESGCGKSTLVRTVFGLNTPTSGRILLRGEPIASPKDRTRRRVGTDMSMVFQDPYSALDPRMTVHDIVAEPLRINRRYDPATVARLLDRVGVSTEMAARRPSEFSGGQRQRVGIARALALEPELIVLDEPVSALDVSIQAQVMNLLQELQEDLGLSYLFISHDLSVVRHLSHRVAVMQAGRFVETGTRDEVFERPAHPYTRTLLAAAPVADPTRRRRRAIADIASTPASAPATALASASTSASALERTSA